MLGKTDNQDDADSFFFYVWNRGIFSAGERAVHLAMDILFLMQKVIIILAIQQQMKQIQSDMVLL